MTNPPTRPASRGGGFERAEIEGLASGEAMRMGHTEVGFEHLLLGILVNGGPGARLLMDAGVTLTEARAAIDDLFREDLALLGVDAPLPPASPGSSAVHVFVSLPLGPRLAELALDCPWSGGDRALLAAMIDDEGGRIRRLLDRLGADTDRIRRDLDGPAETPEAPGTPAPPAVDGGPSGGTAGIHEPSAEGWDHAAYIVEAPVSAERVWDLVGDPARRAEWDPGIESSRLLDDGAVEVIRRDGTTRERIAHSVAGREVTWEKEAPGARHTIRIVIEPIGGHTRLHLRKDWPTALKGRFANRVMRWFMRSALRLHAQAIAQAAS
ncbi:Clp protease N-terminal domain-containing protein [Nocardiopsis sediminis]|uniref:Clp protease N-terminal domain-containing protein n=1 Tax=Nocardiopsis sediminis TaxID=1778267 RepID=A0ABV8FS95_9ACTN